MKNIPEHIILDYNKQPTMMICKNCGEKRELHLPALVDDVIKQAQAFGESHKDCKEVRDEEKCEVCGDPATVFCECESCREDRDDSGRLLPELRDGRWLCNGCQNPLPYRGVKP